MARRKKLPVPELESWSEVDEALHQIQLLEQSLTEHEVSMNKLIEEAKANSKEAARPLQEEIADLERKIQDYVTFHRDDLGEKKSIQLTHGRAGFRTGSKCIVPRGAKESVLKKLHRFGMQDCIKTEESILKDVLRHKPPDLVAKVGCRLETAEEYWYEVDYEKLASSQ